MEVCPRLACVEIEGVPARGIVDTAADGREAVRSGSFISQITQERFQATR